MRNAFAKEITKLAQEDARIHLLSGDIGNRLFNEFQEKCKGRFFNCGVAEQNMVSVGAGMALCGLKPVAYTIGTFMTARCFEQIKLDVCYNEAPVVIVSVGGGLSYATLGSTHHSFEDLGLLRMLPTMGVVCPCDPAGVRAALADAVTRNHPVYIRIGKKGEPALPAADTTYTFGRARLMRDGDHACLIGNGPVLGDALKVADTLAAEGIRIKVVDMHTVKPLDGDFLAAAMRQFPVVATLEEHSLIAGFGSAVAEWAADNGPFASKLIRFGMRDEFMHECGDQDHARAYYGFGPDQVAERLRRELRKA